MSTMPRIIAFDFDGVIAKTSGFVSHTHMQEPNPEVVQAMRQLQDEGYKILVHSTRGDQFLSDYCEKFSIPVDYINRHTHAEGENPGKPVAFVYVDDRCICYKGQSTADLVSEIVKFKPYWRS